MERSEEYNGFLKRAAAIFSRRLRHRAPAGLADRVMAAVALQTAGDLGWGLGPALASSALGAFLAVLFIQGHARFGGDEAPRIISFTVDQPRVGVDQPLTLRWKVVNAKKIQIQKPMAARVEKLEDDTLTVALEKPGNYKFILVATSETGVSRTASTP